MANPKNCQVIPSMTASYLCAEHGVTHILIDLFTVDAQYIFQKQMTVLLNLEWSTYIPVEWGVNDK